MLKSDNLEADDVIAITKDFIRKRNPDSKIIIVTSDMDLLQLIDDNTTLISLKNKILNEKSCGDPKKDLEIKIICGDSSDNIPGCFQRCGHKTALKLINDKSKLLEKFKKEEGSMDRYAINRILIDFENIPNELVKNVTNKIIEQNV